MDARVSPERSAASLEARSNAALMELSNSLLRCRVASSVISDATLVSAALHFSQCHIGVRRHAIQVEHGAFHRIDSRVGLAHLKVERPLP